MKKLFLIVMSLSIAFPACGLLTPSITYAEDDNKINLLDKAVTGSASWDGDTSNRYTNAVDGNYHTYFDGLGKGWIQIDLGSYYDLSAIGYYPRADYAARMQGGRFLGSLDGEKWFSIYTIAGIPEVKLNKVAVQNAVYRYVRYEPEEGRNCNVAEIELYGDPSAAPDFVYAGLVEANANSQQNNTDLSAKSAIDGNTSTKWHSNWAEEDRKNYDRETNPYYLTVDLGAEKNVSRYTYVPRQDTDDNGTCCAYEIYTSTISMTSTNPADWSLRAKGVWEYENLKQPQTATFTPVQARYVRLVFRNALVNGGSVGKAYYASAGEVYISEYTGDGIHPSIQAKENLAALKTQIETELAGKDILVPVLSAVNNVLAEADILSSEMIQWYIRGLGQAAAVSNWIDTGINENYFTRLMANLGQAENQSDVIINTNKELIRFNKLGKDLSPGIKCDLAEEYIMSDAQKEQTLMARLVDAVTKARVKTTSAPGKYVMLEELCGYVDGTSAYGLDADSCEYLVNNINFALSNLEKIEMGVLDTSIADVKSGSVWLDTMGSKISAHGGQIITGGDGKYYWYGEDNKLGAPVRTGVSCYSSPDLRNWTYEGLAFQAFDNVRNPKFAEELLTDNIAGTQGRIERPKVLYNAAKQKYVMWMHLENRGGYDLSIAGVAVSDSPTGPFTWLHYGYPVWDKEASRYGAKQTFRDMNLFADEDGKGYVFYASEGNPALYVVQLNEDYTWINTEGVAAEDLSYPNMQEATNGSAKYDYHLPSFTKKQMYGSAEDDSFQIINSDGRWSRVNYQNEKLPEYTNVYRQREAPSPAMINGRYYLITSGCSGWGANVVRADYSDHILGPYTRERYSLMSGTGDLNPYSNQNCGEDTAFDSQSTCILKLSDGSYMYMGDRWKDGDYQDLAEGAGGPLIKRSSYIWLPIQTNAQGELVVTWQDSWNLPARNEILKVNADTVTVVTSPGQNTVLHSATYYEDQSLNQYQHIVISDEGVQEIKLDFIPQKVFLWNDQLTPYDSWPAEI